MAFFYKILPAIWDIRKDVIESRTVFLHACLVLSLSSVS